MTRSTGRKAPAKKAPAKTAAKTSDPLAATRADTPNPELTDFDRDEPVCGRCGRTAVARRSADGLLLCERHQARAESVRPESTESL